jgi:hypothetical protein
MMAFCTAIRSMQDLDYARSTSVQRNPQKPMKNSYYKFAALQFGLLEEVNAEQSSSDT